MTKGNRIGGSGRLSVAAALGLALLLAFGCPAALAGQPTHPRVPSLDIAGLNHACGAAVDSEGDVYVSSAGESKVKVFDAAHTLLASIPDSNEPCGLAVNGKGELFVSEQGTGKVVRFKPNAYPFVGAPTYGAAEPIDTSGNARGISVDPHDGRLYVAEDDRIAVYESGGSFEADIATGEVSGASGVAVYTYVVSSVVSGGELREEISDRHLFIAEGGSDRVKVFSGGVFFEKGKGTSFATPKLRRTLDGPKEGEDFGFAAAGAYLAADPGNRGSDGKCASVAEQACTAGHLLVYDEAHQAVDEFDATGEFLDQFKGEALIDAGPSAIAVDRSGGAADGTIYATAGSGAGARALAFAPLAAPSRAPLFQLSDALNAGERLQNAGSVAVDSHGNVYVAIDTSIHVFDPAGEEIAVESGNGIPDPGKPSELAVDSHGNVYVADANEGIGGDETTTYYAPSQYPPVAGTSYVRHEPAIASTAEFGGAGANRTESIAIDPSDDHLLVFVPGKSGRIVELDSAANGSKFIREYALSFGTAATGTARIDVCGATGDVYVAWNPGLIGVIDATGTEVLARITGAGSPTGKVPGFEPWIAVDQSNCHVLAFANHAGAAQEYDAAGAFIAEFAFPEPQAFTDNLTRLYDIAVDNSGGPGQGTAYVAFDDTKPATPDVWPFAAVSYGEAPLAVTGTADSIALGGATLHGTVNPRGFDLSACRFEYLGEDEFEANGEEEKPRFEGALSAPCEPGLPEIGHGNVPVAVQAEINGIEPQANSYRFRLVAESKYGESEGDPNLFGPPSAITKPALPVLYTEATLRGEVAPSGLATEYHFEYVDQAHFEEAGFAGPATLSTPVAELEPGESKVSVHAALTGLSEGTAYRFRLVAANEASLALGSDQDFETLTRTAPASCPNGEFRTGPSAGLPDCRAYELVTPAETNGLFPHAITPRTAGQTANMWLATPRGAMAGERLSYSISGTLPGFGGNGFLDGYRAERATGPHPSEGWRSRLFGPSFAEAVPDISSDQIPGDQGVSADQLYSIWGIDPAESLPGTLELGVYLRTTDGDADPACNPNPTQADFELVGCGELGTDPGAEGHYVSPGGGHVIFSSKAHLEPATPPAADSTRALYERAAGSHSAQVVSLQPGGGAFGAGEDASYVAATEDGSAILFKVAGTLYLRRGGETTEVAEAPSAYAGISQDGTRVFYAATAGLTPTGGNPLPASLYVCDVGGGPCAGPGATQEATRIAESSVFLNVSDDGSQVLFSSKENLYAYQVEPQTTHFVAQLDPLDFVSFAGNDKITLDTWSRAISPGQNIGLANAPTRSTPGGGSFLFQSHAKLGPYDNEGHGEIYRYEPAAPAGERLLCVSCDPTNAPPSGDAMLVDPTHGISSATRVASLTDDGQQVFFESPDRLLPEDANDAVDVYEWSAQGSGEGSAQCERPHGCLALISSGQGEGDSHIYAMSADGHDVFFATGQKLVGADVPGSPSIYDARVDGGIPDPPAEEPCHGDSCQPLGGGAPALPVPASTGPGSGDLAGRVGSRCAKSAHAAHRKGRRCGRHRKGKGNKRHRSKPTHRAGAGR